mmetsp:Transcript_4562/g.17974  ORF Transcript_4562/g.17974 Transcript_4562/m.17974 type:complete len:205 (-) Transcript_4562:6211-6825(-)
MSVQAAGVLEADLLHKRPAVQQLLRVGVPFLKDLLERALEVGHRDAANHGEGLQHVRNAIRQRHHFQKLVRAEPARARDLVLGADVLAKRLGDALHARRRAQSIVAVPRQHDEHSQQHRDRIWVEVGGGATEKHCEDSLQISIHRAVRRDAVAELEGLGIVSMQQSATKEVERRVDAFRDQEGLRHVERIQEVPLVHALGEAAI